jgi:hypothetical protein
VVAYDVVHGPPAPPVPRTLRAFAAPVGVTAELPPWLPRWQQRVDTVASGETLVDALARAGIDRAVATRAVREAGPLARPYAARAVRAGSTVYVRALDPDSVPAEITFRPEPDRVVRLTYLRGAWRAAEERLAWRTDTVSASTAVQSTLFAAVHSALATHLPRPSAPRSSTSSATSSSTASTWARRSGAATRCASSSSAASTPRGRRARPRSSRRR